MSRRMHALAVLIAGIVLLVGVKATAQQGASPLTFPVSQIYFEYNFTAQDLGIQVSLDGESWKELEIVGPGGNRLLDLEGKGSVGFLGLTELFFESVEPSFDELTFDEILALFPEGKYQFLGETVEGRRMVGSANLTHDIPDAPVILSPEVGGRLDPNNAVISWKPVTTPAGIKILRYQVIAERQQGPRVFQVDVAPNTTSVTIPKEFLKPASKYICEVLAKEVSGNQTISECSFETN